ncbi:hypothetical protein JCM11491_004424 [Sporobolomyces phaffii]
MELGKSFYGGQDYQNYVDFRQEEYTLENLRELVPLFSDELLELAAPAPEIRVSYNQEAEEWVSIAISDRSGSAKVQMAPLSVIKVSKTRHRSPPAVPKAMSTFRVLGFECSMPTEGLDYRLKLSMHNDSNLTDPKGPPSSVCYHVEYSWADQTQIFLLHLCLPVPYHTPAPVQRHLAVARPHGQPARVLDYSGSNPSFD